MRCAQHFVVVDIRGECRVAGGYPFVRDASNEACEQACGSHVHVERFRVQQREHGVKQLSLEQQARTRHVVVAEAQSCNEL